MLIQQENDSNGGRFFINEDGKDLAEMVYVWRNDVMVIVHTEVDDSLGGKGVGKKLLSTAVAYAREHKIMIHPVCPFAKKVMEATHEYDDVLDTRQGVSGR